MLVVNAQSSTHIDVLNADAVTLQFLLQLVDTVTQGFKVTHVQYLAAYVEVQSHHLNVGHLTGFLYDLQHVAHVDTELVLCQSCRDVGMRVGSHVGVQPECHAGGFAFLRSQLIDNLQFGYALHIEAEDVVIQSEIDFPVSLTYTGIDNLVAGEPCPQGCFYLASTDAVSTQSCLTDDAQHFGIGICLDGIVYAEALMLLGFVIDNP